MTEHSSRQGMALQLRQKAQKICKDWETILKRDFFNNKLIEHSLLRGSFYKILETLANALEDPRWTCYAPPDIGAALENASERCRKNAYQLEQLVDECAAMRKAIVHNVAGSECSTADNLELIHAFLDSLVRHASEFFDGLLPRDIKRTPVEQDDNEEERCSKKMISYTSWCYGSEKRPFTIN